MATEQQAVKVPSGIEEPPRADRDDARGQLLAGIPVSERRFELAGISTAVFEGGERVADRPAARSRRVGGELETVLGLAESHRVIAPDLPAHGSTEGPDGAGAIRAREGSARHATDVRRLLTARIGALSSAAREVLRSVAALAGPTVRVVSAVVENATAALEEALAAEVLVRDGDRLRFAHPIYAAVIGQLAPPAEWREQHRRAAGAVTDAEQRAPPGASCDGT